MPTLGAQTRKLPQSVRDTIRTTANDLVKKDTGIANYFDTSDGWVPNFHFASSSKPDQLSFQQQKELARKLPEALQAQLPPEHFATLADSAKKVEGDSYARYKTVVGPILQLDNTAGQVAAGLAAAGVVGLGGYGVYRGLKYWHNRIRQQEAQKAKRKQDHDLDT